LGAEKPISLQTQQSILANILAICEAAYEIPVAEIFFNEVQIKLTSLIDTHLALQTNINSIDLINEALASVGKQEKDELVKFYTKRKEEAESKKSELSALLSQENRLNLNQDVINAIEKTLEKLKKNQPHQLNLIDQLILQSRSKLAYEFNNLLDARKIEIEALRLKEESEKLEMKKIDQANAISRLEVSFVDIFKNHFNLQNLVISTEYGYDENQNNKICTADLSMSFNQNDEPYRISLDEYLIHLAGHDGYFQIALEILEAIILKIDAHDNLFDKSNFDSLKNALVQEEVRRIFRDTVGAAVLDPNWYSITLEKNPIQDILIIDTQRNKTLSFKEFLLEIQEQPYGNIFQPEEITTATIKLIESLEKLIENNPSFFDLKEDFVGFQDEPVVLDSTPNTNQVAIEKQKHPLDKASRDIQDLLIQTFNEIDPDNADQYSIILVPDAAEINKIALIEIITPDNTEYYHESTQLLDYLKSMISPNSPAKSIKIRELIENIKKIVNENQEYFSLKY
jgi:hypothetical protein